MNIRPDIEAAADKLALCEARPSPDTISAVLIGEGDPEPELPLASDDEPEDVPENGYWPIEYQAEIRISRLTDGGIEIEEISPLGESENVRVMVARSNAVALARRIIWAAGFKSVLIATTDGGGGYSDVEDGALIEHFSRGRK